MKALSTCISQYRKMYVKKCFTNRKVSGIVAIKQLETFFMPHDGVRKVNSMMQHRIKLRLDEVQDFVTAASKCDFDIDIAYNRYVVDAKSIVGVLGLDLKQTLLVTYNGYNAEFEDYMKKFALAC